MERWYSYNNKTCFLSIQIDWTKETTWKRGTAIVPPDTRVFAACYREVRWRLLASQASEPAFLCATQAAARYCWYNRGAPSLKCTSIDRERARSPSAPSSSKRTSRLRWNYLHSKNIPNDLLRKPGSSKQIKLLDSLWDFRKFAAQCVSIQIIHFLNQLVDLLHDLRLRLRALNPLDRFSAAFPQSRLNSARKKRVERV